MKSKTLFVMLVLVALLMSACGPAAVTDTPAQATEVRSTSTTVPTETPAEETASPTAAATETQPVTETSEASIPVTGGAEIRASLNDTYGPILVDGDGNPLYIFTRDTQNGDSSACTDEECLTEWPPLTTEGEPTAGAGAIQNLLGTITREDGTRQVTYNGWPLYRFSSGSIAGHGEEGEWFLVNPSGRAVEE